MKSDIAIKDDIYSFLKGSQLASSVTGRVCKTGERPKDSDKEDILINVVANVNGQTQEAIVNVNVYVADDIKSDGQHQEATIRLRELCLIASNTLESGHGAGYRFTLESQRVLASNEKAEHVINNRLFYQQVNC